MTTRLKLDSLLTLCMLILLAFSLTIVACSDKPKPPPPECKEDLDCPKGKVCEGGKCVMKKVEPPPPPPECTTNDDCPAGKKCVNGKCKAECEYDGDCGPGKACENGRCVVKDCDVKRVNFDYDQYYLTNDAQSTLRSNAECLKQKKEAKIVIEGHCDERGSTEYNLSLGQKRAQTIRDFLIDLGVDTSRIKVLSFGEERPIDDAHSEEAWAKNRRGETVLQ